MISLRQMFAAAANWIDDLKHSPVNPVPEIREELEAKRYRFEPYTPKFSAIASVHGVAITTYTVKTAEGHPVCYWDDKDSLSRQYKKDYDDALARYKTKHPPRWGATRQGDTPAAGPDCSP